ncbi:MAG: PD-(D/E)XK nuclease family protein [candidate division Zixibacteria bacterium]|nr:PD-(D/E)XK nuclease family protein [candidate division Zixibacteria bacterium]
MPRSYSISRLGTYDACPRQYQFQYIDKAVVEKPVSVEAFLGSAVHRTLENLYNMKMNGRLQNRDDMLAFYHRLWEGPDRDYIKVTRETLGVEDYIKVGHDGLLKYYGQYAPFDEGDILALEKLFSFPLDSAGRFMMNCKVDRLTRRPDGVIEIIDYKTGASIPTQQQFDDDDQMGIYQLGVQYLWPDFNRIAIKQIFIRQGLEMTTEMDVDTLEEIRYRAYQRILEIEQAERDDHFPPRESNLCNWCVYFALCPAKRHRLALEGNDEVEFDAEVAKELADRYLTLNEQKKQLDAELKALKDDIVRLCEEADILSLASTKGDVKVSLSENEAFPSKTADEDAYMDLSLLAREAGLEECFKLDEKVLYKEFFIKERLTPELLEKLKEYVIRKRQTTLRTRYTHE